MAEATLTETINNAIDSKLIDTHTALPAEVVSFNPTKQTVNLKIVVKRIKQDGKTAVFPLLIDVPVCFMQTSNYSITFPINAGDTGQVIFNERQIDNWDINGDILPPDDARKHSLSDAVFFPQLTNQKNNIASFNNNDLEIRTSDGATKISISTGGQITMDCTNLTINSENTTVNASTKFKVDSPLSEFTGEVKVDGDVKATGDVVADEGSTDISLTNHVHLGGTLAGGLTGAPQ